MPKLSSKPTCHHRFPGPVQAARDHTDDFPLPVSPALRYARSMFMPVYCIVGLSRSGRLREIEI